jgi:hypothetical protein
MDKILTPKKDDHRISSVKELVKLCKTDGGVDCYIALNGSLRSSKHMSWDGERFWIDNEIDGTFQKLTPLMLMDESYTNIGIALRLGHFYMRWYEKARAYTNKEGHENDYSTPKYAL